MIEIGRSNQIVGHDGRPFFLQAHEDFMQSAKRRQIFVAHRRCRKTSKSLERMFQFLITNPGIVGKTLAPERKQAKENIWDDPDMLFNIVPYDIIKSINKTELKIELVNGSIWTLDGADNPHSKRGGNVKVLHLTEAGDHDEVIWTQVYEPVLMANHGVAIFEGNPRGQNWYYHLYNYALAHPEVWDAFLVSATQTPIFSPEDLAGLQQRLPQAVYAAEYLCDWVSSLGTVFRTVDEIAIAIPQGPQPGRKYRFGIDLGKVDDYTVISIVDRHTWQQVHLARFNQLDWPTQKEKIIKLAQFYGRKMMGNEVEIYIESNGIGSPIFDDLFKHFASDNKLYEVYITPFRTTNESKSLLVSNFAMLADLAYIQIVPYPVLLNELKKFTYKKNQNTIIYSAPPHCHDDTVMSTMISFWNLGAKLPLPMGATPDITHQWGRRQQQQPKTVSSNNPFVLPI